MKAPTQKRRVLEALRRAGPRGVTAVDFLAPGVIDGRAPILGFAARISELGSDGHTIKAVGKRHKCKVFVLVEAPPSPPAVKRESDQALFDRAVGHAPPRSPFDDVERAGPWSR